MFACSSLSQSTVGFKADWSTTAELVANRSELCQDSCEQPS